jgi:hypothetical protein
LEPATVAPLPAFELAFAPAVELPAVVEPEAEPEPPLPVWAAPSPASELQAALKMRSKADVRA